jgi:hypothetical protein
MKIQKLSGPMNTTNRIVAAGCNCCCNCCFKIGGKKETTVVVVIEN